jgi:hypothetical protein
MRLSPAQRSVTLRPSPGLRSIGARRLLSVDVTMRIFPSAVGAKITVRSGTTSKLSAMAPATSGAGASCA